MTPIDGNAVYKISGFRGTARIVDIQIAGGTLMPRGIGALGPAYAEYDLDSLNINTDDGSFEVVLSELRPSGYSGDWWRLDSRGTFILVRQIAYDWLHEIDGRLAIERLDQPAVKPRSSAREIAANLRQISEWAENMCEWSYQWFNGFRTQGLINKVMVRDISDVGGVMTQKYIEGLFNLEPDEALIYETTVPKHARYWNIQLTDMLWSAIDWVNRQSSLNGYSARLDSDGKFRAVISALDPGVQNWLDTAGYKEGGILGRWRECDSEPTPTITKVKFADLRSYLPADTPFISPEARETAIRLRRKGAQLRRRW